LAYTPQRVNINFFRNVKKNIKSIENVFSLLSLVVMPDLMDVGLEAMSNPSYSGLAAMPNPRVFGLGSRQTQGSWVWQPFQTKSVGSPHPSPLGLAASHQTQELWVWDHA